MYTMQLRDVLVKELCVSNSTSAMLTKPIHLVSVGELERRVHLDLRRGCHKRGRGDIDDGGLQYHRVVLDTREDKRGRGTVNGSIEVAVRNPSHVVAAAACGERWWSWQQTLDGWIHDGRANAHLQDTHEKKGLEMAKNK